MIVKGRYVAQVEVDFEYGRRDLRVPFPELRDRLTGEWIDKIVAEAIAGIFYSGNPKTTVTKQYVDVYEVEGEQQ